MWQAVEWKGAALRLLDQRRLPSEVVYLDCADVDAVIDAIHCLAVRGAPAIGIAAAYGVVLSANRIDAESFDLFWKQFLPLCDRLVGARPTAISLRWAVDRMKRTVIACREEPLHILRKRLLSEADSLLREDVAINKMIGTAGVSLIQSGDGVLTHCNTGSLATGGWGTALGIIRSAWQAGKRFHVFAGETRPALQGARLTMWELQQDQIPATLITDNMAAYFMRAGKIQCCIVGADRIAANGDVANKIGTYGIAVLARAHGIPFYVAASLSTYDPTLASGDKIPIEERPMSEVTHVGTVPTAPSGIIAAHPAFDVTPADLITAIITEAGSVPPHQIAHVSHAA
jgi:methylthioribose-1-phosphate isomerase